MTTDKKIGKTGIRFISDNEKRIVTGADVLSLTFDAAVPVSTEQIRSFCYSFPQCLMDSHIFDYVLDANCIRGSSFSRIR